MMKNFILSILAFSFIQSAFAEKIVVLDLRQAVVQTDVAKNREKAMLESAEFIKLRNEGSEKQTQLADLVKKGKAESLAWSQDQIQKHSSDVQLLQQDLQHISQKIQSVQQATLQGINVEIGQENIAKAVENVVKKEKVDLVIHREAAAFASPEADITNKVVDEINKLLK